MTRHRVRHLAPGEQAELYDLMNWPVFVQEERDVATIELGCSLKDVTSIADMSAGGARITPTIAAHHGVEPLLGDLGRIYNYPYQGTLDQTVPTLPDVDLYVCSETIEHLEDPDSDLALIREKCQRMLLTTPVWEEPPIVAHGHLWTWRQEDVEEMCAAVGFTPVEYVGVSLFGIWVFE